MAHKKVAYTKNEDPSFIRQFKQKIGYKEGPNIDTKRQELQFDDDDDDHPEAEDEKPTVVVLKKGDLTAEEAEQLEQQGIQADHDRDACSSQTDDNDPGGKIIFRKPTKRSSDPDLNVSSSKKKKDSNSGEKSHLDRDKVKKVKNTSLLSFGEDEEEED